MTSSFHVVFMLLLYFDGPTSTDDEDELLFGPTHQRRQIESTIFEVNLLSGE